MKIGKYIFVILPVFAESIILNLPTTNDIHYSIPYFDDESFVRIGWSKLYVKECKHIKPNTGIRYKIIGFYYKVLIIKQLN